MQSNGYRIFFVFLIFLKTVDQKFMIFIGGLDNKNMNITVFLFFF